MGDQNLKNHGRYIPLWHFITPLIIAGILGWGIVNFVDHHAYTHFLGASMILISFVLLMLWWFARFFALRAQDRAIRAEENFRHYLLTGKPLNSKLRISQIIALRFASDAELPALAQKAVEENLSQKQIKQEITNWKGDHYRV
jgi:high-affinity Fe2+/Pb2+ permease